MKFISERVIDSVLDKLEKSPNEISRSFEVFSDEQKPFTQYIATENFKLLKEEEYDLLVFILVVIWKSIHESEELKAIIEEKVINDIDEMNWSTYDEKGTKKFNEVVDLFFDDYEQEDLLAFVEDSIAGEEEESKITQVGREIIFITSKTLIDGYIEVI